MSDEDITQTTHYVRAVEAVAEAARRVEEVRVKYDNTMDALMQEKREADGELRAALAHLMELTGKTLPVSEREKERQAKTRLINDKLAGLKQTDSGKSD
jgi:predicted S18 family serine protease